MIIMKRKGILFSQLLMVVAILVGTSCVKHATGTAGSSVDSSADPATLDAIKPTLFPFKAGDGWGYVDASGKVVISPKYFGASPFTDGLAMVTVGDMSKTEYGYIDSTGKTVIEPKFSMANSFSDGLAAVCVGGAPSNSPGQEANGATSTPKAKL